MGRGLEVISHPAGPWLVKAGHLVYAVPPRLGRALRPLAGKLPDRREIRNCLADVRREPSPGMQTADLESWVDELVAALQPSPGRGAGRAVRFRLPVVSVPVVSRLAGGLKVLAGNRGLTGLALLGGLGYLAAGTLVPRPGPGPAAFSWDLGTAAAGLGLFLLTAIWHELGHAAALARSGYPPGGIGAGVLFVIPVLFADVTAVGAVPRAGRIRVDLAGVAFQWALGGVFFSLGNCLNWPWFWGPSLALAGSSALLAITWSLFPFMRSDGYWLLCDLLGLDSLDRPPSLPVANDLRLFLVGYQLANAAFLLLVGVYFPWKMMVLLGGLARRLGISPDSAQGHKTAAAVGIVLATMLGMGVIRRVLALVRSARAVACGSPTV